MPRFHNINGESVQFTAEEEAARDAEEQAYADAAPARALAELRRKRDDLLKESDWTQLPDALTPEKRASWAEYRQLLRDLPEVSTPTEGENNELLGVTWPTEST